MNFKAILHSDVQKFIIENTTAEVSKLAFLKNPFPNLDYKVILNQIECRQKSKTKLPTWFSNKNNIYPSKISIEQTSSEVTAKYKASIITGESLIDLSGGFGVDALCFSESFKKVIHCEMDTVLSEIVTHNFKNFNVKNVQCIAGDSLEILRGLKQKFDWIYIDPSRRNDAKGKVFLLNDCTPNVPKLLNEYFTFAENILIKTAPILDLTAGLQELNFVKKIHIIAVDNEVKELLWEIEKNYNDAIKIITKNFTKTTTEHFEFDFNSPAVAKYGLPQKYLYEPNSAIMKSGGFDEIAVQFDLKKLHQHSHLYSCYTLKPFPGRIFTVEKNISYTKKEIKLHLEKTKKNITTRNFPETVEHIRKKWTIREGGNDYCFFTTDKNDNKIVLICTKI